MSLSRFISLAVLLASTALVSCSPLPANTNTTPADIIPRALGYNCGPQYYSLPEADDAFGDGIRLQRNGQAYAYTRANGQTSMSFLFSIRPSRNPHFLCNCPKSYPIEREKSKTNSTQLTTLMSFVTVIPCIRNQK
jgi:hypothetical protein